MLEFVKLETQSQVEVEAANMQTLVPFQRVFNTISKIGAIDPGRVSMSHNGVGQTNARRTSAYADCKF